MLKFFKRRFLFRTLGDLILIVLIAVSCYAVNRMNDNNKLCPPVCEIDHIHHFVIEIEEIEYAESESDSLATQ